AGPGDGGRPGTQSVSTGAGGAAGAGGSDSGAGGEAGVTTDQFTGEVLLEALVVTGAEVPLKPGFDPRTWRYSVLAANPARELQVTATAASHLNITIAGIATESGVARALPSVEPGGEFEVVVSDAAGRSRAYTVLYLPSH